MKAVWLSSTYYLDEAVQKLSPNAERMLTRSMAHCGSAESSGYVSEAAIKMLGLPNPRKLANELVDAQIYIPRAGGGWDFRSWESWNSAGDALIARRKADAARQARRRAAQQEISRDMSRDSPDGADGKNRSFSSVDRRKTGEKSASSDAARTPRLSTETSPEQDIWESPSRNTSRDVTPPEESREEQNSSHLQNNGYDSNANEPRSAPIRPDAWKLVRAIVPSEHPQAVRTELALQASALLKAGHPAELVADALRLWTTKGLHPKTLPSLVSELINTRNRPAAGSSNVGQSTSKVRRLAELAAQERAKELAAATSHPAKELER